MQMGEYLQQHQPDIFFNNLEMVFNHDPMTGEIFLKCLGEWSDMDEER